MNHMFIRIVLSLLLYSAGVATASSSPASLLPSYDKSALPSASALSQASGSSAEVEMEEGYASYPLNFEANAGQSVAQVKFLSRGEGYALFLTPTEAVLSLDKGRAISNTPQTNAPSKTPKRDTAVVRMRLTEANSNPVVTGLAPLPGKSNYFIGDDPTRWRTDVPHYAKVEYQAVYPGIDLVYYGKQRQLEYDFIVAPNADPKHIRLAFEGAENIRIDERGNLILSVAGGELIQHKPFIYQDIGGERKVVEGRYMMYDSPSSAVAQESDKALAHVGFQVTAYDATQALVIDPILSYSTYLGGHNDEGAGRIAVDEEGNAYVTGVTFSSDFPTTSGVFDRDLGESSDMFITKLNATGTALIYSTFLGGNGGDNAPLEIAVDTQGNVYLTGSVGPPGFPTTPGAFDRTRALGDVFVTKLNAAGNALIYSTFLGGSESDGAFGMAIDASGNAYLTGSTRSSNFPTTPGAFDRIKSGFENAFVTKLNPTGTALIYSTLLGGSHMFSADIGRDIAVDEAGNAYLTGITFSPDFPTTPGAFDRTCNPDGRCVDFLTSDLFVTKLNATGTALLYSTYLGGDFIERNPQIAIDSLGHAYLTGDASPDFPLKNPFQSTFSGGFETFMTKLNPTGTELVYSTLLGGSGIEFAGNIAVDGAGSAYVVGSTGSTDFPVTPNSLPKGSGGAYVTKFNATGSGLVYSVILRDAGAGALALDRFNNVYIAGRTTSPHFPTTPGAFDRTCGTDGKCNDPMDGETPPSADAFVAKLSERLCLGRPITLLGTRGDDVLNGTPGPDVIDGLGGNDTINGRGGDDFICGGFGNDTLAGNDGNDRLHGGRDTDRLFGHAGNDLLLGKGGNDALDGGAGIDTCNGEGLSTDPADTGVDTAVRCENVDNVP